MSSPAFLPARPRAQRTGEPNAQALSPGAGRTTEVALELHTGVTGPGSAAPGSRAAEIPCGVAGRLVAGGFKTTSEARDAPVESQPLPGCHSNSGLTIRPPPPLLTAGAGIHRRYRACGENFPLVPAIPAAAQEVTRKERNRVHSFGRLCLLYAGALERIGIALRRNTQRGEST